MLVVYDKPKSVSIYENILLPLLNESFLFLSVAFVLSLLSSIYWDYALTVPLRQIVCIHCHQRRESLLYFNF